MFFVKDITYYFNINIKMQSQNVYLLKLEAILEKKFSLKKV